MKVEISIAGIIRITAESETEEFALDAALGAATPRVSVNGVFFELARVKSKPLDMAVDIPAFLRADGAKAEPIIDLSHAPLPPPSIAPTHIPVAAPPKEDYKIPLPSQEKPAAQTIAVSGFEGMKIMGAGVNADVQNKIAKLCNHPHFQDFACVASRVDISTLADSRQFALSVILSRSNAIKGNDGSYNIDITLLNRLCTEFRDWAIQKYKEDPL